MIQLEFTAFCFGALCLYCISSHPIQQMVYDYGDNLRHKRSFNIYIYPGQSSNITLIFNNPSPDQIKLASVKTHHAVRMAGSPNNPLKIGLDNVENLINHVEKEQRTETHDTNKQSEGGRKRIENFEESVASDLGKLVSYHSFPGSTLTENIYVDSDHSLSHNAGQKTKRILESSKDQLENEYIKKDHSIKNSDDLTNAIGVSRGKSRHDSLVSEVSSKIVDHPVNHFLSHSLMEGILEENGQIESDKFSGLAVHNTNVQRNDNIHEKIYNNPRNPNQTQNKFQEFSSKTEPFNFHEPRLHLSDLKQYFYSDSNSQSVSGRTLVDSSAKSHLTNDYLQQNNSSKAPLVNNDLSSDEILQTFSTANNLSQNHSLQTKQKLLDTVSSRNSTKDSKSFSNQLYLERFLEEPAHGDGLENQSRLLDIVKFYETPLSGALTTLDNNSSNHSIKGRNMTITHKDDDSRQHSEVVEHSSLDTLSTDGSLEDFSNEFLSGESFINDILADGEQSHSQTLENEDKIKFSENDISEASLLVRDNVLNQILVDRFLSHKDNNNLNNSLQSQHGLEDSSSSGATSKVEDSLTNFNSGGSEFEHISTAYNNAYDQQNRSSDHNLLKAHGNYSGNDEPVENQSSHDLSLIKENSIFDVLLGEETHSSGEVKHISTGDRKFIATYSKGINNPNSSVGSRHTLIETSQTGNVSEGENHSLNQSHYNEPMMGNFSAGDEEIHSQIIEDDETSKNRASNVSSMKRANLLEQPSTALHHTEYSDSLLGRFWNGHQNNASIQNEPFQALDSGGSSETYNHKERYYFLGPQLLNNNSADNKESYLFEKDKSTGDHLAESSVEGEFSNQAAITQPESLIKYEDKNKRSSVKLQDKFIDSSASKKFKVNGNSLKPSTSSRFNFHDISVSNMWYNNHSQAFQKDTSTKRYEDVADRVSPQQLVATSSTSRFKLNDSLVHEQNSDTGHKVPKPQTNSATRKSEIYNRTLKLDEAERSTKTEIPLVINDFISNAHLDLATIDGSQNHSKEENGVEHLESESSKETYTDQFNHYKPVLEKRDYFEKQVSPLTATDIRLELPRHINSNKSLDQSSTANKSKSGGIHLETGASLGSQYATDQALEEKYFFNNFNKDMQTTNIRSNLSMDKSQGTKRTKKTFGINAQSKNTYSVPDISFTQVSTDTKKQNKSLQNQNQKLTYSSETKHHPVSEESSSNHKEVLENISILKHLLTKESPNNKVHKTDHDKLEHILTRIINAVPEVPRTSQNPQSVNQSKNSTLNSAITNLHKIMSQNNSTYKTNTYGDVYRSSLDLHPLQGEFGGFRPRKAKLIKHSLHHMVSKIKDQGNGYSRKLDSGELRK